MQLTGFDGYAVRTRLIQTAKEIVK